MNRSLVIWISLMSLAWSPCLRAEPTNKPTCAILTFDALEGVTHGEARALSDGFSVELDGYGAYRLMSRSKMDEVLKLQAFSRSENCSATECALEAGKMLSVEYMVYGSVGKVGTLYSLTAYVVSVESGVSKKSATVNQRGGIEEALITGVGILARKLAGTAAIRTDKGSGASSAGGAELDDLVAQVRAKEGEQKRLEEERVEAQRQLAAEMRRRKADFDKDHAAYLTVVGSKSVDAGMKQEAWKRLTTAWGVKAAGVEPRRLKWDDATGILVPTGLEAAPGEALSIDLGGGIKLAMVWIPPGEFDMGDADATPVHRVKISSGFWMGKYEVTQEQWERVMGSNPSNWKGANLPVEKVSWDMCQEFVRKMNSEFRSQQSEAGQFRLPTEAEWEYACRAGTTTKYWSGDEEGDLARAGWYLANSDSKTHPVGQKAANAWGLYDVHGNVWEWCQDWYGAYSDETVTDPTGPGTGEYRVVRGGGWSLQSAYSRCAFRYGTHPALRYYGRGVRVVVLPRP
ncbi:MAG: formylglycine-generating enzyme family protein [bacterium]